MKMPRIEILRSAATYKYNISNTQHKMLDTVLCYMLLMDQVNVEYSEVVKMSGMQILNIMALIYILTHMRRLKYFDPRIRTYYYPSLIDLCSSAVCYDCARTSTVFNG